MRAFFTWLNSRCGWLDLESGGAAKPREIPVIISLTTIPERLHKTAIVIECLLRQTAKPDRLILWPDKKLAAGIPPLLRKQTRRGLEIRLVEDIGPYTKIIYALKEFPGCRIVTADDDVFYPESWLAELLVAHERNPRCVTCHRAHCMAVDEAGQLVPYEQWGWLSPGLASPSSWLFPTGVCGVLYPPNALHPEVFNQVLFQKICPTADDVWLKAMALLNGVPCQKVRPHSTEWTLIEDTQRKRLSAQNVEHRQNDVQIRAVFDHYDLYSRLSSGNCNNSCAPAGVDENGGLDH